MAIVLAGIGIIGGAVVGVIAKKSYSDYSDDSDYDDSDYDDSDYDDSDYDDSDDDDSDYSDYSKQKERARQEALRRQKEEQESRRREARRKLDQVIANRVRSFENREGITVYPVATSDECKFKSFSEDMKEMDAAARKTIKEEIAADLRKTMKEDERHLKELNELIVAINKCVLDAAPGEEVEKTGDDAGIMPGDEAVNLFSRRDDGLKRMLEIMKDRASKEK